MADEVIEVSPELKTFADRNRELDASAIDYETGAFAPVILGAGLNLRLIRFTEEQFKWLLSSAITGAYIIYPENPLNAIFPLLECVDMPISDCEQIASCIQNSQNVRDALEIWFGDSIYNQALARALEELELEETGYDGSEDCNTDRLFGSITAVLDELHDNAVDFLEILEAQSQAIELLNTWGDAVTSFLISTGAGGAAAGAVIIAVGTLIEQNIQDLIQNYDASYTNELRDALRCEFLCYALENDCSYTAKDILLWLEPQVELDVVDVAGLIAQVLGVAVPINRRTVLRMWYMQLKLYEFAITNTLASFFASQPAQNTMMRLVRVSRAAQEDDSWGIICDPCGETVWSQTFDFTISQAGWRFWNNDTNRAQWVSGEGWRRRLPSGGLNGTRLMIESPAFASRVTEVKTEFSYAYTLAANGGRFNTLIQTDTGALPAIVTHTGSVLHSGRLLVQVLNSPNNSFPIGQQLPSGYYIRKVTLSGIGTNPF